MTKSTDGRVSRARNPVLVLIANDSLGMNVSSLSFMQGGFACLPEACVDQAHSVDERVHRQRDSLCWVVQGGRSPSEASAIVGEFPDMRP